MKKPADKTKSDNSAATPVFPQTMHTLRTKPTETPTAKAQKRDNIFSKSRDTREDRGERQIKTHNPQTMPHGH